MAEPLHPQEYTQFTVGDRCRKAREFAGFNQEELAERIEVARSTVSNYESGATTRVRKTVLRPWALACGVDFQWLLTGAIPATSPDGGQATHGYAQDAPDQEEHTGLPAILAA